VDLTGQAQRRY